MNNCSFCGKGYYLDNETKSFKPCFESCFECNIFGSIQETNCNSCKEKYYLITNHSSLCINETWLNYTNFQHLFFNSEIKISNSSIVFCLSRETRIVL